MNELTIKNQEGSPIGSPLAGDLISQGSTMTQVKTSYATAVAVQRPRPSLEVILRKVQEEAMISGEEFYYSWAMKGGKKVEGPSVKMTNAIARIYGNCVVECLPVQETKDSYIFTTAFVDLETGYTNMRPFRQSKKWQVYGKFDEERKEDIRFQIGFSKSSRNTIVNSLPAILFKKAMEKAKEGVRTKIEDYVKRKGLPMAIQVLTQEFAKVGVSEDMLAKKICKKLSKLDVDDIVLLKGDLQALQDGVDLIENLFPNEENQEEDPMVGLKSKKKTKKKEKPQEKTERPFDEIKADIVEYVSDNMQELTADQLNGVFLTLTKKVTNVASKGIDNLTPKAAETVLQLLKEGDWKDMFSEEEPPMDEEELL